MSDKDLNQLKKELNALTDQLTMMNDGNAAYLEGGSKKFKKVCPGIAADILTDMEVRKRFGSGQWPFESYQISGVKSRIQKVRKRINRLEKQQTVKNDEHNSEE